MPPRPAGAGPRRPVTGRRQAPPHEVRIVGGTLKRSKLPVLDSPGLRPTPQRVRETLFNWLGQDLSGWRCLDAFAGSGALGFEAVSRGAAEVVLLEREPVLLANLQAVRLRLGIEARTRIERADALSWMRRAAPASFDLVLLDPPFGTAGREASVAAAAPLVRPGGWLYFESDGPLDAVPDGCEPWREDRAGAVCAHLLRRKS